jgi:hypothetical protein
MPPHLLGRHVANCPEHVPGIALRLLRNGGIVGGGGLGRIQLRQSEVENLYPAIFRYEDVFRLQVAVDNSGIMGRGQATCNLYTIFNHFP